MVIDIIGVIHLFLNIASAKLINLIWLQKNE